MLYLAISVLCQTIFIVITIKCLKESKRLENADKDHNNFCISIKHSTQLTYFIIIIQTLLFCIYTILYLINPSKMWIFPIIILAQTAAIWMLSQNKFMISGDQIIKTRPWGAPLVFTFKSIKKIDITLFPYAGVYLILTGHDDNEICKIGFYYTNVDLLIERLKSAGVSGITEIERNAGVSSIINIIASEPGESRHFEIAQFDVKCDIPTSFLYYCALILLTPLTLFIIYEHIRISFFFSPLLILSCIAIYFAIFPFNVYIHKMTYNNNVFECRNFWGFKREFKIEDISYVNLLPNKIDLRNIRIFLRNGKCIARIGKDYDNFDLLIKAFKHAGVEFK